MNEECLIKVEQLLNVAMSLIDFVKWKNLAEVMNASHLMNVEYLIDGECLMDALSLMDALLCLMDALLCLMDALLCLMDVKCLVNNEEFLMYASVVYWMNIECLMKSMMMKTRCIQAMNYSKYLKKKGKRCLKVNYACNKAQS